VSDPISPLTIAARFNGPPTSGNGGYVAGLLARRLGGTVAVRLHRPPPLDRALEVRAAGAGLEIFDGDQRVASAQPDRLELEIPEPPGAAEAARAAAHPSATAYHPDHPFPGCFACGPARAAGDGLRLFPGSLADREDGSWATPWVPDAAFADAAGVVLPEIVWAALDCPSSMPVMDERTIVLGTLCGRRLDEVRAGETYRVLSWPIGVAGRKRESGVAIFDAAEDLVAAARATWIELA